MKPAEHKIYLASKSPRRRDLLRQIGVDFVLLMLREQAPRGPDVDEVVHPGEHAIDYVARVSRAKAECARQIMLGRRMPVLPVLSADTTVVIDDRILGKPTNMTEAKAMLGSLSSRTHQVLTSVTVCNEHDLWQTTQCSDVTFATLTPQAIDAYCATSEPYDKAGGYGIQGIAASFIERIAGSYTGIMGLPLFETTQLLQQAGIRII
ncbi:MAG: septum formation inhibitor Maf [Burkholderiaceae bacterium]|nr:septum formation inhibitor Maf [Burkholderiaceae bacterium]